MATIYVWDGGSDESPYDDWTTAATELLTATAAATDINDIILVDKEHSEVLAGDTLYVANASHTTTNPLQVIVVDKDDSDIPVDDYSDMGANGIEGVTNTVLLEFENNFYFWGMRFIWSVGTATPWVRGDISGRCIFENCELGINNGSSVILYIGEKTHVLLINCFINWLGEVSHKIALYGSGSVLEMFGGSVSAVYNPLQLFDMAGRAGNKVLISGVDLSGIEPIEDWLKLSIAGSGNTFHINNCAFPASPPPLTGDIGDLATDLSAVNCGGTDGRYYSDRMGGRSSLIHDTTTHRDGGAEYDGSNGYSFNIITVEVTDGINPFRQLLAVIDAGSLSGKDLEIHITHDNTDNSNKIQNDEIWAEFHALDESSGVHWETTRSKPTATPSDLAASTETWTSGKAYKQKISHTWVSGATSGLIYCYICVAKAYAGGSGEDVFICPKVEII